MNHKHIFNKALKLAHQEVYRKVAIHEAGHAAAIYLGNKRKGLPPVFFQIFITPVNGDFHSSPFLTTDTKYIANLDGGRLIHTLPSSIEEATHDFSSAQIIGYQRAFEADMINMLVGSLAEAKYIAERINPRLIYLNAVYYFDATAELEAVNEYLDCFIANSELRKQKITELFLAAFNFVNERSNWQAITALADYIVNEDKSVVGCNEVIDVLETVNHGAVF